MSQKDIEAFERFQREEQERGRATHLANTQAAAENMRSGRKPQSAQAALARLVNAVENAWPGNGLTRDSTAAAMRAAGHPEIADAYLGAWSVLAGRHDNV